MTENVPAYTPKGFASIPALQPCLEEGIRTDNCLPQAMVCVPFQPTHPIVITAPNPTRDQGFDRLCDQSMAGCRLNLIVHKYLRTMQLVRALVKQKAATSYDRYMISLRPRGEPPIRCCLESQRLGERLAIADE